MGTSKKVIYPFRDKNGALYDAWYSASQSEVDVLGSGTNYTAFLHNGITSLDVGPKGGPDDPVYHHHSNYDSYH